jgi:hypothetical protein
MVQPYITKRIGVQFSPASACSSVRNGVDYVQLAATTVPMTTTSLTIKVCRKLESSHYWPSVCHARGCPKKPSAASPVRHDARPPDNDRVSTVLRLVFEARRSTVVVKPRISHLTSLLC